MADYYSILTKTISGLNTNTPELRQAVYSKARKSIEGQLRQLEPKPGEEAIKSQLNLLEKAIVVVESEYEPAVSELESADSDIPDSISEITSAISEQSDYHSDLDVAPEDAGDADSVSESPVSEAPPEPAPSLDELAPLSPPEPPSTPEPPPDILVKEDEEIGVPPELIEQARDSERSGIGSAIITLIVLGLLGSGAYAAWLNRDALTTTLMSLMPEESVSTLTQSDDAGKKPVEATQNEESVPNVEEPATGNKETVRLGDDGQEVTPKPTEPVVEEVGETQPPVVIDQPEIQPETPEPEGAVEPADEEETATQNDGTDDAGPVSPSPLGEIAYLYEEGSAGSGATRSNARINWSVVNVKPTAALPAEPVIMGNMEVPEKGISVQINIKRNVDESLSASHIIEMTFEIPEGFSGGSIENIARFVLKPSEEARGEPLVAVPVKVSEGFFLIALDNLDQAVQVNRQLLINSGWIDIPISYGTGKRALLTLEKGGSGDEIFKQAFADWQNR